MTDVADAAIPDEERTTTSLSALAPVADLIGSASVAGVPVLFARGEGPVSGGIFFRVGWSDEELSRSGITHLVEHLALHGMDLATGHHNGETTEVYTHFHATGSEAEVVGFLNEVCSALSDLSLDRIETEKSILRTESSSRSDRIGSAHMVQRYGSQGRGLFAYSELGLAAVTRADVQEWLRTRFTRANAAIWITTAELPVGLEPLLPVGVRVPAPSTADLLPVKPAFFSGRDGGVFIDAVVPRSTAATLFARVAAKALFRELRHDGGYSYTADCAYEPISGDSARVRIYADALTEQQAAVVGGAIDVLARLRAGTISEGEMTAARAALPSFDDTPAVGAALLPSTALNLLMGHEILHPDALERERAEVTVADVARVAGQVWDDALAQLPEGTLDWAGFTLTPSWSESRVVGRRYPRADDPSTTLVIGESGVSIETVQGVVTVLFDECTAVQVWPDGARGVFGRDGFHIPVEPTLHVGLTPDRIAELDTRIPARTLVPMPARAHDAIPQPAGGQGKAAPTKELRWRGFGSWAMMLGLILLVLVPILAVLTAVDTGLIGTDGPDGSDTSLSGVVLEWGIVVVLAAITVTLIAGVRRRRLWNRVHGR